MAEFTYEICDEYRLDEVENWDEVSAALDDTGVDYQAAVRLLKRRGLIPESRTESQTLPHQSVVSPQPPTPALKAGSQGKRSDGGGTIISGSLGSSDDSMLMDPPLLAAKTYPVGARISANWQGFGSAWYPGRIERVHEIGTYDVLYDDGDREEHVTRSVFFFPSATTDPSTTKLHLTPPGW